MKKICFIANRYPTKKNPGNLVFFQQLIWGMADLGIECTVICPIAINLQPKDIKEIPYHNTEETKRGNKVSVYYPRYIGYGQRKIFKWNTANINLYSFYKSVKNTLSRNKIKPDGFYGHFISPAGVTAAFLGRLYAKPAFFAYGESSPWSIINLGKKNAQKYLKSIDGIIAVSTKNKNDLVSLDIANEEKISVIPNAIDPLRFNQKNKNEARKKIGLPEEEFIISFVGQFIERKGIDKLDNAISKFDDVYAIYAGSGEITPKDKKTLLANKVHPDDLAYFYSASDVFVLPTNNEGCSNAIIEAMACGLPIISSNQSFNDDILDDSCSIRIDVESIDSIYEAIKLLKENPNLREQLSKGAILKAEKLTIHKRASKIINYINK